MTDLPKPPPPGDAQVRAVATEFLRLRPWIVAPFLLLTLAAAWLGGSPRAQVVALACGIGVILGFFFFERSRGRRHVVGRRWLLGSLVATLLGIAAASALTGATASPLLPMLFAPVGVGFAAFGRAKESTWLLAILATLVIALAIVAPWVHGFALSEPSRRVALAAAVIDAALLLRVGVASLSAAHARAAETLAVAGDELVRAADARSRALEALGDKVAHEVKNPLSAIRAIVDVMREAGDERDRRRLEVAASEVARIEKILDDFGSLGHPFDVVDRRPTDIAELVATLLDVLDARAERAGVALSTEPGTRPGAVCSVDRDRIKEALLNLLLNALDATAPGGRVTVGHAIADDGALSLRVIDTGDGIDATTLSKVGTPYFTTKSAGTGLGVASATQVAKLHGGTLRYDTAKGRGTTVTLHIPAGDEIADDGKSSRTR